MRILGCKISPTIFLKRPVAYTSREKRNAIAFLCEDQQQNFINEKGLSIFLSNCKFSKIMSQSG